MTTTTLTDDQRAETEARCQLYWWFATVFSEELTEAQLTLYQSEAGQQFLTGVTRSLGVPGQVAGERLQQALQYLCQQPHPRLELAVEFTESFLRGDERSVMPYASVYLSRSGLLFQQPHDEMQQILAEQGLAVSEQFREPADHLGVMLDYLGNLVLRGLDTPASQRPALQTAQQEFIQQRLLSWIPKFVARCQALPGSGFYPAIATLLLLYLEQEQAALA